MLIQPGMNVAVKPRHDVLLHLSGNDLRRSLIGTVGTRLETLLHLRAVGHILVDDDAKILGLQVAELLAWRQRPPARLRNGLKPGGMASSRLMSNRQLR